MNKGNFSKEVAIAAGQKMKEREYWLNQLAGDLVKSSFPRVRRKAVSEQPLTHSKDFSIPADITRKLIELGNGSDFRLHIILTAGLIWARFIIKKEDMIRQWSVLT
ncbi:MAG: hypothetical protein MUF15_16375 [Acidobacteria bacterium]|nr:hypothetical protein [Acidobacteriota bacterium]